MGTDGRCPLTTSLGGGDGCDTVIGTTSGASLDTSSGPTDVSPTDVLGVGRLPGPGTNDGRVLKLDPGSSWWTRPRTLPVTRSSGTVKSPVDG